MKAISPNAFVPQVMRKWEPLSHFRHTAMKCGVETRYLRESWKARSHCVDALNGTRQVKRSKRNELTEFSQEGCIYSFCRGVVRSAVAHSMAGGGGARKSRILGRFGYGFGTRDVLGEGTTHVDQNIIVLVPDPKLTGR